MSLPCVYGLAVILSLVGGCLGYSSGAPSLACTSMYPQHGPSPQATTSPYSISASAATYDTDDTITVTVTGTFKGILLQARIAGTRTIVGSWGTPPPGTRHLTCQNIGQSAITHSSSTDKTDLSFQWTAPSDGVGDIEFVATIVQVKAVFWTGVKSSSLSQLTTTTTTTTTATTTVTPSPQTATTAPSTVSTSTVNTTSLTPSTTAATPPTTVASTVTSSASATTTLAGGRNSAASVVKMFRLCSWLFVSVVAVFFEIVKWLD